MVGLTPRFNPWVGCEKVSPGCAHCYAEELVTGRMGRAGTWGRDGTRERTSEANWRKPLTWERYAQHGLLPDGKTPSGGRRPRIFCASLADVFEPRPELEQWRCDLFRLIEQTPSLDWQLLTKRPEVARDWLFKFDSEISQGTLFTRDDPEPAGWGCPPNLWIGTSIENSRFTWRADVLRDIPAVVRFISAEPLLGSLFDGEVPEIDAPAGTYRDALDLTGIDWVIVGGESGGPAARPMHPAWARELRDACLRGASWSCTRDHVTAPCGECDGCRSAASSERPAFYFKQWGSWGPAELANVDRAITHRMLQPNGEDRTLRPINEHDRDTAHLVYLGGSPKAGGKLLDGREWCEFPPSAQVEAGTLF